MSFSLANIFGGGNSAPAPAAVAPVAPTTAPGNLPVADINPTVATPAADANGVVPAATVDSVSGTTAPVAGTPDDLLAPLTGLWDTDPNAAPTDTPPAQLNPAELQAVIAKGNFANNVAPEIMQRIEAGGPEAVAANLEAMNSVAQNVMLQSTLAANKMIEQQISKAMDQQLSNLPGLIKKHALSENLVDNNPMLSDPRIAPITEMLQARLQFKNPTATSQQLTEMTSEALTAMGQHFTGSPTPTNSPRLAAQQELNWDEWALSGPG